MCYLKPIIISKGLLERSDQRDLEAATMDKERRDRFLLAARLQLNLAKRSQTSPDLSRSDVSVGDGTFPLLSSSKHKPRERKTLLKLLESMPRNIKAAISLLNRSKIATVGLFAVWCGLGQFAQYEKVRLKMSS